ncbi:MAG: helix-turn-helix domain-containing protein [Peptostreptococcaceae bacterium]
MNTGDRIKIARSKIGMTQKRLGELINKSESSIRKYESGYTTIPIDVLSSIADVLDITIGDLLECDNHSDESLSLLKKYLESKNHFITDIKFLESIDSYISEYIDFKIYEKNKKKKLY